MYLSYVRQSKLYTTYIKHTLEKGECLYQSIILLHSGEVLIWNQTPLTMCSKLQSNVLENTALHLEFYKQKPSKPILSSRSINANVTMKLLNQATGSHVVRNMSNAGTTVLILQHGECGVTLLKLSTTPCHIQSVTPMNSLIKYVYLDHLLSLLSVS